jgi:hypothetical protein
LSPAVAGGQNAPAARDLELTLPQARDMAARAVAAGQPALARQLALGLLSADPRSSYAHFVLANAQGQMGQPTPARRSAARAYRYADTSLHRFEAAEMAARLSYAEERPTLTQLWLRRAVQNAPDKQIEAQLGRDYARVRALNPLSFSLRGAVRPSNNVNNGADTAVQIIDGLPFTGILSGSAQALSGVIGSVDAKVGYKLRTTDTALTRISARLYVQRVALDSGSKAKAPGIRNGDLGSTFGEVALTHLFAVGKDGDSAELEAAAGQYWAGGSEYYTFARLGAEQRWLLNDATRLTLGATVEQRASAVSDRLDSTSVDLQVGAQHKLANGDGLSLLINLRATDGDFVNIRTNSAALRASYSFGEKIGPAQVSAGLVLGYADYPDYVALLAVPGGRQDRSAYGDVNLFFPDMDYAGFAPTLRMRAGRKFSNVSRFETRELSVSLGIESKF